MLRPHSDQRYASWLSACVLLFAYATSANAQSAAQESRTCLVRNDLVVFELVLGRLQLSPETFRIGTVHERTPISGDRERVTSTSVSVLRGRPTLQYQERGGDETWRIACKSDHFVHVLYSLGSGVECQTLTYQQPVSGPVSAKVEYGDGRSVEQVQGVSLWHIAIEEPDFFGAHLQPLLMRLNPSWDVAALVANTQNLMNKPVHQSDSVRIQSLVRKLDDPCSAERSAAALELGQMGLAAEQQLCKCLTKDLSPQQKLVIEKLIAAMQPVGNDTPMRLAVWMSPVAGSFK